MKTRIAYVEGSKIGECLFIKDIEPQIYFSKSKERYLYRRQGLFKCVCGKEFKAVICSLKNRNTKSCGCYMRWKTGQQGLKNTTHGLHKHPLYYIWCAMLHRCNNVKNKHYKDYGERGIKLCERWCDINNFIEDMYLTYSPGLEIDRIDNAGNYELSNCRWITRKENCNNRRSNRIIEYKGVIKNMKQWSESLNIPYNILMYRLNNWGVEKTFTSQISYK